MTDRLKQAPRLGMGCWAIGGPFWAGDTPLGYAGANDDDSMQAIHASWEAGIRIFDTSSVYGGGHSETLLGQALGDRSDAIIVSKFGHSIDMDTKQMTGPKFDPAYVKGSVEQSLKRLRRDHIDVMLLHLNGLSVEEALPAFDMLEELRDQGRIASYGWSTDLPDSLDVVAGRAGFSTVQHAMNLFHDAPSLSAVAMDHGLVQLVRSPLAMGVLTGKYSDGYRVANDDVRSVDAQSKGYFENAGAVGKYVAQLEAVRELITVDGRSLAQGALCWLLAKSPNMIPLPGSKNAQQAQENARALEFGPLAASVMAEIETVLKRPANETPYAR